MATRILVVDDHPIILLGVVTLIEAETDLELVGEAKDGEEALNCIFELKPDIAIIDLKLPKKNGLEVINRARMANNETRFIVLTMHQEPEFISEAMEMKVDGYVSKENPGNELIAAIRSVLSGAVYISPGLREAFEDFKKKKGGGNKSEWDPLSRLTVSEKQILKFISKNFTSREISEKLLVSVRTVQNHRASICHKLGLKGANKLLEFAIKNHRSL